MTSFVSCRDKMDLSRKSAFASPKRIQFVWAWPSLSFHIFYVKCPMILHLIGLFKGGSRIISEGFRFDRITVLTLCIRKGRSEQTVQTKSRRGVLSGSTLFATHPAILHTFIHVGCKMDFLKTIKGRWWGAQLKPPKPLWIRPLLYISADWLLCF